jgi:hypothetical protein
MKYSYLFVSNASNTEKNPTSIRSCRSDNTENIFIFSRYICWAIKQEADWSLIPYACYESIASSWGNMAYKYFSSRCSAVLW